MQIMSKEINVFQCFTMFVSKQQQQQNNNNKTDNLDKNMKRPSSV